MAEPIVSRRYLNERVSHGRASLCAREVLTFQRAPQVRTTQEQAVFMEQLQSDEMVEFMPVAGQDGRPFRWRELRDALRPAALESQDQLQTARGLRTDPPRRIRFQRPILIRWLSWSYQAGSSGILNRDGTHVTRKFPAQPLGKVAGSPDGPLSCCVASQRWGSQRQPSPISRFPGHR